jgi:hypothetical protein
MPSTDRHALPADLAAWIAITTRAPPDPEVVPG